MSLPSYSEIEHSLGGIRAGRSRVMKALVHHILNGSVTAEPFDTLSRFFCRLKSADSIVEKMSRKGITVQSVAELPVRLPDILGFRVIVANLDELTAVDELISRHFEVLSRKDWIVTPGEFGERGLEYTARYDVDGVSCSFELQLRTFLQHHWANQTFHLFHKKPRELALQCKDALLDFSNILACAEKYASQFGHKRPPISTTATSDISALFKRVHLVVVEPGERFADHVIQPLSGDNESDHEAITAQKISLYAALPGSAIVECSCLDFLAFHLNEPLVQVLPDRWERVRF